MKQVTKFLGLIFLTTIIGCHSNNENAKLETTTAKEIVASTPDNKVQEIERKLIKEGRVEFETENISSTRQTVFKAVEKYKGYVSSDQQSKSPGRISNTIVIRVPAEDFDNLLKEATTGVDKFESKEIKVKDVTKEFIDIQTRLKVKKELETRYLNLLKQTTTITEILEIENKLDNCVPR